MAKFYVRVEIEYEVEAESAEAALLHYETGEACIVNKEVFDEEMNFVE